MLRTSLLVASLLGALAAEAPRPDCAPAVEVERADATEVRGMTISCQRWGEIWGTDLFAEELDELRALGVNWVAIHPYARIHADGSVTWRALDPAAPPAWLERPLREARARGMSFLLKPHLAYWGSPFGWRGEIDFAEPEQRARFWAGYRAWIVELARALPDVDGFVVGTELDRFLADESEWRGLIAELRAVTRAHLTYAANWTDYQAVPFWDALDAVGVQAYFPLTRDEGVPDEEALRAGWEPVLAGLRELHRRTGKPVVFTELGYNASFEAARQPWSYASERGERRAEAERLQARCLEVGLEVVRRERDWLRGAFLWKWFAGEVRRANFLVDTPSLRAVLGARWGGA